MAKDIARETERRRDQPRSLDLWRPWGDLEGWPSGFGAGFPWRTSSLFSDWPWQERQRGFLPAMDVTENDDHYTISVELPGGSKDDVQVELHEGLLTIRGEKKCEREEKKEQRCYVERSYGSFSRSFRLPDDADAGRLDASFKNGVLSVTIPKTEKAKPKAISVRAG
jgi:HSP20 family protein